MSPYRLLCIDDEASGLRLRQLVLEHRGYSVSTAGNVADALALFRSGEFDAVVTDHLLGRETATSMAAEMKRMKPSVPIIVLSGTTEQPEGSRTFDGFVSKGDHPEALFGKLNELLAPSEPATPNRIPALPTPEARPSSESQQQLLAAIVESSDDAIFSKTLEGTILSWNKAAEAMYGYRAEEIVGKPVSILLPPNRRDEVGDILERLNRGEKIEHAETVRVAKGGRLLTVSLTVSPVHDSGGRIIGASTIARDITQSKLAEESLRKSEKLALAGRIAATLAHEINNPLEAITNALFLVGQSPSLDANAREFLKTAEDELARMREIVNLTLRQHRGDSEQPQQVRIPELINDVLALYGRKLRTLGITVRTGFDADVPVSALAGELRQVFSNLIINAADALENTGDRLVVHVFRSRDRKNPAHQGVRITIADNGSGIPPEKQAHIFESFYTTKGAKGTGIGLWVTLSILKKYGGTIRFRSTVRPGRCGTVFQIFLPTNIP